MSSRLILISGIAALALFGTGYWYGHATVAQTVATETETTKKNVVTIIHETKRPDGTIETSTQIIDKSKEKSVASIITVADKRAVTLSATASVDYKDLQPTYGLLVQKPFLAEKIELGAGVDTTGRFMLILGWNF